MVEDTQSLEARARRRVARKMGLGIHALVYVLVNAGLWIVDAATGGRHWAWLPTLGWGVGLTIHAIVTFVGLHGDGWREQMVAAEVERRKRRESG